MQSDKVWVGAWFASLDVLYSQSVSLSVCLPSHFIYVLEIVSQAAIVCYHTLHIMVKQKA